MGSLNVFGFLGGNEVKGAGVGNLGLHDRESKSESIPAYCYDSLCLTFRADGSSLDQQVHLGVWGRSKQGYHVSIVIDLDLHR